MTHIRPTETTFIATMRAVAAVAWLICLPALALAAPASVLEQAASGIEAHRKADAEIRVVQKDGTALPGAKIEVVQRTHDFAFGNVFRPCHYENEEYRTKFLELFNFVELVELVELNWGQ